MVLDIESVMERCCNDARHVAGWSNVSQTTTTRVNASEEQSYGPPVEE